MSEPTVHPRHGVSSSESPGILGIVCTPDVSLSGIHSHVSIGEAKTIALRCDVHVQFAHQCTAVSVTVVFVQCVKSEENGVDTNEILQCRSVKYSTVQHSTVQYSAVQYSAVQYSAVQYSAVQYSAVQYIVITSHCGRSLARPSLLPQWDLGTPL